MSVTTFDTLAFTKKLRASGLTEEQAEAHAEALAQAMESQNLATKSDLLEAKLELIKWMIGTTAGAVGVIIVAFLAVLKILVP